MLLFVSLKSKAINGESGAYLIRWPVTVIPYSRFPLSFLLFLGLFLSLYGPNVFLEALTDTN